jgi:hypothetical protein
MKYICSGVLTPEEFVAAGDQLVYRCPTWRWETGDPARIRPYLPEDKQFLVTKGGKELELERTNLSSPVLLDKM